jgi:23S rRNA pseudouridine1911/1915/1917 synthase
MRQRFAAPLADRIDKLLAANTRLSRNKARALLAAGGVQVDGKRVTHPAQQVAQGALVEIRSVARPDKGPELPVRYQDPCLIIVDKPAGLPAQADREGHRTHVYGMLAGRHPYVGLHHRLDTPASGLLLLTLQRGVNPAIAEAFQHNLIRRTYMVVVLGDPGEQGEWSSPIDGDTAHSRFRRLSAAGGMSLLLVRLSTGRTHQIRRHAAEAGHPIIGDRRYGGAAGRAWTRLALHAWALDLRHPLSGEELHVEAPVPADLRPLFQRAGWKSAAGEE